MTYILIAAGVVVLWLIFTYNKLVSLRNQAQEAVSDIDVQAKRRYDLIPNLVETVKGYMTHERQVLENVTAARAKAAGAAGGPQEKEQAENALTSTLKTLFAVAENYPDLKANANFLELQRELADIENKMMAARRFYNGTVRDLNTAIQTFPTNLVAGAFGFSQMKFFELASAGQGEPVKVSF